MDTASAVYKLLKYSLRRDALFSKIKEELAQGTTSFRTLCPTKWIVRARTLKSVVENYVVFQVMLTNLDFFTFTKSTKYTFSFALTLVCLFFPAGNYGTKHMMLFMMQTRHVLEVWKQQWEQHPLNPHQTRGTLYPLPKSQEIFKTAWSLTFFFMAFLSGNFPVRTFHFHRWALINVAMATI